MAASLENKVFTWVFKTTYCTKLFMKPQRKPWVRSASDAASGPWAIS